MWSGSKMVCIITLWVKKNASIKTRKSQTQEDQPSDHLNLNLSHRRFNIRRSPSKPFYTQPTNTLPFIYIYIHIHIYTTPFSIYNSFSKANPTISITIIIITITFPSSFLSLSPSISLSLCVYYRPNPYHFYYSYIHIYHSLISSYNLPATQIRS